jgi:hypothetical protein
MTAREKADEYLQEFSVEKSIDIAKTMLEVASTLDKPFWKQVIKILKQRQN